MKIRKATKKDFEEYYKLKQDETEEYSRLIKKRMKLPPKSKLKKEFNTFLSDKNTFIFVIEEDNKLIAYFQGSLLKSIWENFGYIDDIFVSRKFRRQGLGTKLIKNFIKILKSKKIKKIRIGVNSENKKALLLYKKLGFKITHYEMDKRLK